MNRIKWIIYILAGLAGGVILLVSLVSSAGEFLPVEKIAATQHSFYFSHTILPDHIAYPLLMMADKVQLKLTPYPDKIWLQVEYGWRRLDYTRKLLKKGKPQLALTTFTKSQKYFIAAIQKSLDSESNPEIKKNLLKHATLYISDAKVVGSQFNGADKAVVDQLLNESAALRFRLLQSL